MIVLGLDFETTGLDPEEHRIIEIGSVLWDTETNYPLQIFSTFCFTDGEMPDMEPEAFAAHGITYETAKLYGVNHERALARLNQMIGESDAVIAHYGAQFDESFYAAECARYERDPYIVRVWIDTAMDIKYKESITTRKLDYLAAENGFLNPFSHRAVFDVLTMLRIFQNHDAAAALELAKQPFKKLQAIVSFNDKDKAKERGYRWEPDGKQWLKTVRESEAEIEIAEADFKVVVLATEVRRTQGVAAS